MKPVSDKIPIPYLMTRFLASLIDFGLAVFLSVFGAAITIKIVQNTPGKVNDSLALENVNVSSTHLVSEYKNGQYLSYTSDQYFEKTETGYRIIDALSYFYTVYLAGDTEKCTTGDIVAVNANEEVVIDGQTVIPKNYYTVNWFNVNVLGLADGERPAKYDYFVYQKDSDDNIDYTKIGTVNPKYIQEDVVNAPEEMINYVYEQYKKAASTFYEQNFIVDLVNYIDGVNNLVTFLVRLFFIIVIFEVLPLSLKRGKTLGKLLMRLSLVKPDGEPIKRWQVIPRGLIIVLVPLFLYLVTNLIAQIVVVSALFIADMIIILVNKNGRMIIHDFIAQTVVMEDPEKKKKVKVVPVSETQE